MSWNRIKYYSKYDGAGFDNLVKAEKILNNFEENRDYDINDILELYQIKRYFDNDVFLPKWSSEDIESYNEIIKKIWSVIVRFWNQINSTNLLDYFGRLECWTIESSFWKLTSNLSTYKNISHDAFNELIISRKLDIRAILYNQKIVNYYGQEIRSLLLTHKKSAELLLSQYVEKHNGERKNLYFPNCLTLKDKEDIIIRYLDFKDANLNFVNLVLNIKKQNQLEISDTTRLKAQKLKKKLNDEIFDTNSAVHMGVQVSFDENQEIPFKYSLNGYIQTYSYSTKYIFAADSRIFYLSHFVRLFKYLDNQQCISLVNNDSDLDLLEKIFMSSKYEYKTGIEFNRKDNLSLLQLIIFDKVLIKDKNSSIEQLIQYCATEYLEEMFSLKGFRFRLPSVGTDYLEKIPYLLIEFDALLRQYKLYAENGEIDYDLFRISSEAYNFSQIPSFKKKKYCYPSSNHFSIPFTLLFSDQSGLCYVEPFKGKDYHCFFDLLLEENVSYENYHTYQTQRIDALINDDYLFIDDGGFIRFKDVNKIFVVKQLYSKGVLNYWHYNNECRSIIDDMVNKHLLYFEDTLFNKNECDYFNYFLNKKEFTNGLNLRNSFIHGTNPDSENEVINLYYMLLRIIVLAILKINDDQMLLWDNRPLLSADSK